MRIALDGDDVGKIRRIEHQEGGVWQFSVQIFLKQALRVNIEIFPLAVRPIAALGYVHGVGADDIEIACSKSAGLPLHESDAFPPVAKADLQTVMAMQERDFIIRYVPFIRKCDDGKISAVRSILHPMK
jgi:hypothetical protein